VKAACDLIESRSGGENLLTGNRTSSPPDQRIDTLRTAYARRRGSPLDAARGITLAVVLSTLMWAAFVYWL
jgi:hypothetical protein